MNRWKSTILCLLVLLVAGGAGWGTYTFSAPSRFAGAEEEGEGHQGHDHAAHATKSRSSSSTHPPHGDDEDLEDLFAGPTADETHDDRDDHDGHVDHDHAAVAREDDAHAGHDHDHGHDHEGESEICPEHRVAEAQDALCQPDRVNALRPGEGMKVRLAGAQTAGRVGISAVRPLPAGEEGIAWPGQVVFNRDRLARLSALVAGSVQKVHASLGAQVGKGEILAEITSPEVTALQGELAAAESRGSLAEAVYRREKELLARGITSRHEFEQAEAELRQAESAVAKARRQMRDLGLTDGTAGGALAIRAPFAGTVIERSAVAGEAVSPGTPLFAIADLSRLWVEISVPEEALLSVHPGLQVVLTFSGLPGRLVPATVFWVAPSLDERTRMLKVLAEIDNREGVLRSGLFGQARPAAKLIAGALAVPADALQTLDGHPFLFVQLEEDLFELRRVSTGGRSQGTVVIREGLRADERIVTAQAFSLKSEVLRARLGASCADH